LDSEAAKSVETITRDLKFYAKACDLARQSNYITSKKVGCVAAKNTRLLAGAFNTVRNSNFNVPYGLSTFHAEMNVLRMLDKPDRVTLYIARIGQSGELPSRPCKRCMLELEAKSIHEIVYLDRFGKVVKEKI
jgi:deoxycytidylate deaminase